MSASDRTHTSHDVHHNTVHEQAPSPNTKAIWRTFWILLIITIFEVAIAFTSVPKEILKYTFITLTIVKAYFIVFNFMHLGHERVSFKWAILLPMLFIVFLIFIALYEGNYIHAITF
jgi:cytochrome c oxidase subunit 4